MININSFSQSAFDEQGLSIGDTLPEVRLTKIFRQEGGQLNLKSFYSKLLILDFWGTWCDPCILAMPKMDSLQTKYRGQLRILPVSDESYDKVKNVMQTNPVLKHLSLPSVTGDSKLNSLFQHRTVPHEVWINEKGIVVAISSELEVTEENINVALQNKTTGIRVKQDEIDFEQGKPIIKLNWQNGTQLTDSAVDFYSVVTKFRPGLPSAIHLWVQDIETANRTSANTWYLNGFTNTNGSSLRLFIEAFCFTYSTMPMPMLNPNRVILDVHDSLDYMEHTDTSHLYTEEFMRTHSLNYEMKIAKPVRDSLFGIQMIQDLNRYFKIKGRIVKKEVDCWILVKKDKRADTLSAKPGIPETVSSSRCIGIRNKYLKVLISYLNVFDQMEPIIDETGIDHPVDLDIFIPLEFNYHPNVELIRKSLNKYGLDLIPGRRMRDLLYLTDKPENY